MSFLTQNSDTYINIKLTDTGRRRLAQGRLTFDSAVISDREMKYDSDRRYDFNNLNANTGTGIVFSGNSILSPKDDHPFLPLTNYDGSQAFSLTTSIHIKREVFTAQTQSTGIWSAITEGSKHKIGNYHLDLAKCVYTGYNRTSLYVGSIDQIHEPINVSNGAMPNAGDLVYHRFALATDAINSIELTASTFWTNQIALPCQWYRVKTLPSSNVTTYDRNSAFVKADSGGNKTIGHAVYRFNHIDNYLGSAATVNTGVWNLNIVRTSRHIGHAKKAVGSNTGHSYTNYGSTRFNGAKQLFDFDQNQTAVGFLHYSNEMTGQTYWDGLVPGTVEVDMPDLMWHRATDSSGNFFVSGTAISSGHRFVDYGSDTYLDAKAGSYYTKLKDGITGNPLTVGRVYYDLKTIVITDPELLAAMSYKSNRNWTLPPMEFSTTSMPKAPFTITSKPGFMKSNHNYYVTYFAVANDGTTTNYSYGRNFGQQLYAPCNYIQKLSGYTDENGNHRHLRGTVTPGTLPYMRTTPQFDLEFSGTGWSAVKWQILVQEVPANLDNGIDSLHPGKWSGCSSVSGFTAVPDPAGAMIYGNDSHRLIGANDLYNAEFIVSQADITTGNTYPLLQTGPSKNLFGMPEFFNIHDDLKNNGLNFGGENMFNGNIKCVKKKERYDTYITLVVGQNQLNTSLNSTFDSELDSDTYVTEIGVLNSDGELVAVGKPTRPIKKNSGEWKVLQLKLEF